MLDILYLENFHAFYSLTLNLFYSYVTIMLYGFWLIRVMFLFQLSLYYQGRHADILTLNKMSI